MDDCRPTESGTGLPLISCDWGVGKQGYDDKLQANQGAGGRADNHVEILPSGERCHRIIWSLGTIFQTARTDRLMPGRPGRHRQVVRPAVRTVLCNGHLDGPMSTGLKPTSRIKPAALFFAPSLSPQ